LGKNLDITKKQKTAGGMAQVVEHLPSKCKALSSKRKEGKKSIVIVIVIISILQRRKLRFRVGKWFAQSLSVKRRSSKLQVNLSDSKGQCSFSCRLCPKQGRKTQAGSDFMVC
jgi:hypothetical protein